MGTGCASEEQRNIFEIKTKKHGIVICGEIFFNEVMSPLSELSDIILVPASWYIEESLFEDTIIEKTNNYNVPLVISNRGRGFYDRTKLKVYDKSIEGKYHCRQPKNYIY